MFDWSRSLVCCKEDEVGKVSWLPKTLFRHQRDMSCENFSIQSNWSDENRSKTNSDVDGNNKAREREFRNWNQDYDDLHKPKFILAFFAGARHFLGVFRSFLDGLREQHVADKGDGSIRVGDPVQLSREENFQQMESAVKLMGFKCIVLMGLESNFPCWTSRGSNWTYFYSQMPSASSHVGARRNETCNFFSTDFTFNICTNRESSIKQRASWWLRFM